MSGKVRQMSRKLRTSLVDELGASKGSKKKRPQQIIGYDGENFTRNGQRTTRDSLRMG